MLDHQQLAVHIGADVTSAATISYRPRGWVNDQRVRFHPRDKVIPSHWYNRRPNFGDVVSPVVLAHVSGLSPKWVTEFYAGKVLAVGSLLHRLQPGDVVWGTGAIRDKPIDVPNVRYLAVRGPLSRGLIRGDVPEIYGDPATLLPGIYKPNISKRFEVGVIPHYMDWHLMQVDDPSVAVINPLSPWHAVIDLIASCQVVISSSLHGIILAEAYGVRAVWTRASDRLVGGTFKFRDYYLSTEREVPEAFAWSRGIGVALKRVPKVATTDVRALTAAWLDR